MKEFKIVSIENTCSGFPSQWEGKLEDGRMFYIRYRHGDFTIDISEEPTDNIGDAIGMNVFYKKIGDDGIMDFDEMYSLIREYIETDRN